MISPLRGAGTINETRTFRDGHKDRTRNLEILRCAIAHRSLVLAHHPGMTGAETVHRSSGGMSLIRAQCAMTSSRSYLRCTRLSDGSCFSAHTPGRHSLTGRIGRGANPPPQFGQTLASLLSTQSAQNVHS